MPFLMRWIFGPTLGPKLAGASPGGAWYECRMQRSDGVLAFLIAVVAISVV